ADAGIRHFPLTRVQTCALPTSVTAAADATVGEVMSILHDLDARHLPIVDGRQLVGIISDRDLRAFGASELLSVEDVEDRRERLEIGRAGWRATVGSSARPVRAE